MNARSTTDAVLLHQLTRRRLLEATPEQADVVSLDRGEIGWILVGVLLTFISMLLAL